MQVKKIYSGELMRNAGRRVPPDRNLAGMITVEMVYIVPLILFVFFLSIMGIFYYHDKQVIASCAYEAAVVGSTKAREKNGVTEETVRAVFEERVRGKCILFEEIQGSVQVGEERIVVKASASKRKMRVSVIETASVTKPEEEIRKYRKFSNSSASCFTVAEAVHSKSPAARNRFPLGQTYTFSRTLP